jgi:hypothetical protein
MWLRKADRCVDTLQQVKSQLTIPYPAYKQSPARKKSRRRIVDMDQRRAVPGQLLLDAEMDHVLELAGRGAARPGR